MVIFEHLFGQPADVFKKTVILTPFLSKGFVKDLGIERLNRGNPFSSGQGDDFTLVHTQIGAPFVGDATLYLKDTSAEQFIFWGACGAVQSVDHLSLGTLVTPAQTLNCESFSQLLNDKIDWDDWAEADPNFLNNLIAFTPEIQKVQCASFGSFKLESKYYDSLVEKKIDVLEMETAAFFHAAHTIQKKALAIFYITDILNEKHVFEPMTPTQQAILQLAQTKGAQLLKGFSKHLM